MSRAALFLHVSADAPDGDFTGGNRADGRSVVGLYADRLQTVLRAPLSSC